VSAGGQVSGAPRAAPGSSWMTDAWIPARGGRGNVLPIAGDTIHRPAAGESTQLSPDFQLIHNPAFNADSRTSAILGHPGALWNTDGPTRLCRGGAPFQLFGRWNRTAAWSLRWISSTVRFGTRFR